MMKSVRILCCQIYLIKDFVTKMERTKFSGIHGNIVSRKDY